MKLEYAELTAEDMFDHLFNSNVDGVVVQNDDGFAEASVTLPDNWQIRTVTGYATYRRIVSVDWMSVRLELSDSHNKSRHFSRSRMLILAEAPAS